MTANPGRSSTPQFDDMQEALAVTENKWLVRLSSISVFLFGSLALIAPSGYSWGPAILFLAALLSFAMPPRLKFPGGEYRPLMAVLLLFFAVALAGTLWHTLDSRTLDRPIRFIAALLVLPFLARNPPKPVYFWTGIALGALLAGGWAGKQVFLDGLGRAHGDTQAIQFGNISILMGMLSLVGFLWSRQQERKSLLLQVFTLLGVAGGITGSVLSGTRGGWIVFPIGIVLCLLAHRSFNSRTSIIAALALCLAAGAALAMTDNSLVNQRSEQAIAEATDYFETGNAASSVGARLEMWKAAILLGAQKPVMGWGEIEVEKQKRLLVDQGVVDRFILQFTHAHSDFFDSWQKRGAAGLIALLLLYFWPLVWFLKKVKSGHSQQKPFALGGAILCLACITFSLTQAFFEHNSGVMVYAFMLTILWNLTVEAGHQSETAQVSCA